MVKGVLMENQFYFWCNYYRLPSNLKKKVKGTSCMACLHPHLAYSVSAYNQYVNEVNKFNNQNKKELRITSKQWEDSQYHRNCNVNNQPRPAMS